MIPWLKGRHATWGTMMLLSPSVFVPLWLLRHFFNQRDQSMQDQLLQALKRAISALNMIPSFRTAEGIKSYDLLAELDPLVREAEARSAVSD